jgi:glucosamine-phosphate N-acetyltransferase
MIIRQIDKRDSINYITLIESNILQEDYNNFIDNILGDYHCILVIEQDNTIIGTGTLLIERKMTYGGCSMGHIENILIDKNYRSNCYGEKIVKELLEIANKKKCYRVDLNCSSELERFYSKNNLEKKHICMNIYFNNNFN